MHSSARQVSHVFPLAPACIRLCPGRSHDHPTGWATAVAQSFMGMRATVLFPVPQQTLRILLLLALDPGGLLSELRRIPFLFFAKIARGFRDILLGKSLSKLVIENGFAPKPGSLCGLRDLFPHTSPSLPDRSHGAVRKMPSASASTRPALAEFISRVI